MLPLSVTWYTIDTLILHDDDNIKIYIKTTTVITNNNNNKKRIQTKMRLNTTSCIYSI